LLCEAQARGGLHHKNCALACAHRSRPARRRPCSARSSAAAWRRRSAPRRSPAAPAPRFRRRRRTPRRRRRRRCRCCTRARRAAWPAPPPRRATHARRAARRPHRRQPAAAAAAQRLRTVKCSSDGMAPGRSRMWTNARCGPTARASPWPQQVRAARRAGSRALCVHLSVLTETVCRGHCPCAHVVCSCVRACGAAFDAGAASTLLPEDLQRCGAGAGAGAARRRCGRPAWRLTNTWTRGLWLRVRAAAARR
jgi:hypothetical protein